MSDEVVLYHLTAPGTGQLGAILAEGVIRTTESNVSFVERHAGPQVVWLTDDPSPSRHTWHHPGGDIKIRAVLTVSLPSERVERWDSWADRYGVDEETRRGLIETGGSADTWWVTEQPIYKHSIIGLEIRETTGNGVTVPAACYEGDELRKLFQSAGRRRSLGLIPTKTVYLG